MKCQECPSKSRTLASWPGNRQVYLSAATAWPSSCMTPLSNRARKKYARWLVGRLTPGTCRILFFFFESKISNGRRKAYWQRSVEKKHVLNFFLPLWIPIQGTIFRISRYVPPPAGPAGLRCADCLWSSEQGSAEASSPEAPPTPPWPLHRTPDHCWTWRRCAPVTFIFTAQDHSCTPILSAAGLHLTKCLSASLGLNACWLITLATHHR